MLNYQRVTEYPVVEQATFRCNWSSHQAEVRKLAKGRVEKMAEGRVLGDNL